MRVTTDDRSAGRTLEGERKTQKQLLLWCRKVNNINVKVFISLACMGRLINDLNQITRWKIRFGRVLLFYFDFVFFSNFVTFSLAFSACSQLLFLLFSSAYWWDNVTCTSSPVHLSFWRVVQSRTHSWGRDVSPPQTFFFSFLVDMCVLSFIIFFFCSLLLFLHSNS